VAAEALDVGAVRTEQRDRVFCAPRPVLAKVERVRIAVQPAVAGKEPAERDLLLCREHFIADGNDRRGVVELHVGTSPAHAGAPTTGRRRPRHLRLLRPYAGVASASQSGHHACVADQKPPRLAGDDRAILCALLRYQRESFVRKVAGLDNELARASVVDSGTNLLWLTQHMAQAEQTWIIRRFAGVAVPEALGDEPGSITDAITNYRVTWDVVDDIVASAPSLDALCHDDDPPVNLRWILAHLLEETARHAGHADILRELIDGRTGR
jgi:Protein of unknown function (DUF664)